MTWSMDMNIDMGDYNFETSDELEAEYQAKMEEYYNYEDYEENYDEKYESNVKSDYVRYDYFNSICIYIYIYNNSHILYTVYNIKSRL